MERITIDRAIADVLRETKYVLISANELTVASDLREDRQRFFAQWDDLRPDRHLKGGTRFRQRRFAYFYYLPIVNELLPFPADTPYFQSRDVNSYAGGIQRSFEPLSDVSLSSRFLHELIAFNFRQLPLADGTAEIPWRLDVHQVRIVGCPDEPGEPTPEGVHHDENDFVLTQLIARRNCCGGVNTVHDNQKKLIDQYTLLRPLDSLILWDPHVMHGVTPITPEDPSQEAIRDTLLIGFDCCPDLQRPETH